MNGVHSRSREAVPTRNSAGRQCPTSWPAFQRPSASAHCRWLAICGVLLGIVLMPLTTLSAAERELKTPADLRAVFGLDGPAWQGLGDGRPLSDAETEWLLRVLYRWPRFPLGIVERWAQPADKLPREPADVAARRGQFFRVRGAVTQLDRLAVPPPLVERLQMAAYYRCVLQGSPASGDASAPLAVVYAAAVPQAWQGDGWRNASAEALAMLIKSESPQIPCRLILAADRLAWHPATPLGRLGMDVGLLDDVRDQTPLGFEDREAFYQMLAAVGRAEPGALLAEAAAQVRAEGRTASSVVPLFNAAARHRGELVLLEGSVRRAVKIVVREPEVAGRFCDHYYEMDLFTADSQENPLVVCTPALPAGMPVGDGPHYRETVRLAGFLFKTWAYPLAGNSETGQPAARKRLAPLLIAAQPQWLPEAAPGAERFNPWIVGGGLLGGVLILTWAIARYNLRRRALRRSLPEMLDLPE